eukprot:Amastigsp_a1343_454.p2 type:complete len:149 gc:universal Amastigsp_a1343_454:486-40(-)
MSQQRLPISMPPELQAMAERAQVLDDTMAQIKRTMNKLIEKRQALQAQLNENSMVQSEFKKLSEGTRVFKLIGPALVRQDPDEAVSTVEKRIEYITGEITRLDDVLKAKSDEVQKLEEEGARITKTFQDFNLAMQRQAAAAGGQLEQE